MSKLMPGDYVIHAGMAAKIVERGARKNFRYYKIRYSNGIEIEIPQDDKSLKRG